MKKNLISIIIVNWNGERWLKRILDSIRIQSYKKFEVILVDNDSSDGSIELLLQHYSWVKIIQNTDNLGFATACNIGIDASLGSDILLINNDAWIELEFLENLVREKEERGLDVIGPREAAYDTKKSRKSYKSLIDPLGHATYLEAGDRDNFFLTGSCLLFSKQLYLESYGLDNNFFMYCEEVDWFWRLNLLQKKFDYSNGCLLFHFSGGSTGNGMKPNIFLWRNQNTLQMLLKNYKLVTLMFVLPLYILINICEVIAFIFVKPEIAFTYVLGWVFSIKHIDKILTQRRRVQSMRTVGDIQILKKMYLGSGKLVHLKEFAKPGAKS